MAKAKTEIDETPGTAWAREAVQVFGTIKNAASLLTALSNPPESATLAELMPAWDAMLGDAYRNPNPIAAATSGLTGRAESIENAASNMLHGLQRALIARLHDEPEPSNLGIVLTAAFEGQRFIVRSHGVGLSAAFVDWLPEGHRLRTMMPQDDYYRCDGRPALILGSLNIGWNGEQPKAWYRLKDAIENTRAQRAIQRREEWDAAAARDREREVAERERAANPEVQLADARRRISSLEAALETKGTEQ